MTSLELDLAGLGVDVGRLPDGAYEAAARALEPTRYRWPTPGAMASAIESDRPNVETEPLRLIDRLLLRVATGQCRKAMIFMPPQAGKSERVSRRFPLWLLASDPSLRIAIVSYQAELAVKWGRQIKRDIEENPDLGLQLREDSKAAGRWQTEEGGGIYCTSIGGSLTGQAVDVLIIDDPVKDRADAESQIMRDRAWDWWDNVAKVRARVTILIQTRWHTDDLAGRMLEKEPGEWEVLSIPALSEGAGDPLGRPAGVEIETPRWERGHYVALHRNTDAYVWASVYQQRPTAAAGGIFKRGDWQFWTGSRVQVGEGVWSRMLHLERDVAALDDCDKFITVDLASSTKTSADWTVAAVWAITPSGDLVLLDRARVRVPEVDHAGMLAPLRQQWLGPYDVVHVESRMLGTTLVYALGKAGVPIAELKADKDKLTRALPYAGLVRQRRVWLPRAAPWLDDWISEHADFPNVAHDDQVDVGAYAARVAIAHRLPPMSAEAEAAAALAAAPVPGFVDLMTEPW